MRLGLLFIMVVASSQLAIADDAIELRKQFHECLIDQSKTERFHKRVMSIENPSATEVAYQAASKALMAKRTWNPIEKISYINKYGRLIDQAIKMEPNSIEIRFLRLSIDFYTPMILGRKDNVKKDKYYILEMLKEITKVNFDASFNRFILYFLKDKKIYSESELALVVSKLNT